MRSRRLVPAVLGLAAAAGPAAHAAMPGTEAAPVSAVPLASIPSVAQVESALADLDRQEKAARAEAEAIAPQAADLRRRLVLRGRMLYRMSRAGLLPVGGGFAAFVGHAMRFERARRTLEQDAAAYRGLAARQAVLAQQLQQIAVRRAPIELEQQALARARTALEEAEDRRRAFEKAFASSTGPIERIAVYGGAVGPDDPAPPPEGGFAALRGRMPFPIAGRAEVRVVARFGSLGPGVEMRAPAGTSVRAVYAGRVAFADRYDPAGHVVILDHGGRWYTLTGNLGTVDVRVGDDVSSGARIGTVGGTGDASFAYLEIRRGANTLAPGPWLGL